MVLKIRNWFFYYFTGKIHGVGQRMDEKIRNVMRLEEKQETKQQEKLSKISKTTHIISRKKPNKFRTPKNNSSYSRKKVNFSCRNFFFFSWNAPRLTRDGHKIPLPKLKSYWKALLLKKQPNFELNNLLCKKNLLPRKFYFFLWFFFFASKLCSRLFLLSSPFRILYSESWIWFFLSFFTLSFFSKLDEKLDFFYLHFM